MVEGRHLRKHRRGIAGAIVALTAALFLVAFAGQLVGMAPARATGGGSGTTVRTVINIPLLPLTNLCNADVVTLHGDMYITTTTTPRSDGSFTVRTVAAAPNLTGEKVGPTPPLYGYKGQDVDSSFTYVAPPPYPGTRRVAHWTKLVPQANAQTMYLVVVMRQTVNADGTTVTTAESAYLACKSPSSHFC